MNDQNFQAWNEISFNEWIETDEIGQAVFKAISEYSGYRATREAATMDTLDDVRQKALIYLWQRWDNGQRFEHLIERATGERHLIGLFIIHAFGYSRCKYAKRAIDGREDYVPFEILSQYTGQVYTPLKFILMHEGAIRATDLRDHDRVVNKSDLRQDIEAAVNRTVERVIEYYEKQCADLKTRRRTTPDRLKYITQNIIEAYMYHYVDQHSPNGQLCQFIANRGIRLNAFYRWKPIVLDILAEELQTYKPL